jgi:hypothetical protein
MRSELGQAVRRQFRNRLREEIRHFDEVRAERQIGPGSRLYHWHVGPALDFYVLLQMHQQEDWFTLELAWTHHGRWPAYALLPGSPDAEPREGDLRFRLGDLWTRDDVWWQLAPRPTGDASFEEYTKRVPIAEALAKVQPLVEDAVQRLVHYGLPYMARVAERHGTSLEP